MEKSNETIHSSEDYSEEEKFDYFNSDLKQLIIHILLEGYFRNNKDSQVFTLDQFLKGDYWKIEEISEAIRDTNDYGSVEDMVLNQIIEIVEVLNIGRVRKIGIRDILELPELLIRKILKEKLIDEDEEFSIGYYTAILDEIYELKKKSDTSIEERMKMGEKWTSKIRDIYFDNTYQALRDSAYTCVIAPSHIEIEITFIDKSIKEIGKQIDDYLFSFSQDDFIDKKPDYKQKRYYFSKQLENFYNYIKELPVINSSINIPFSILSERGFEVVKILAYLEREKKIKVRNWNDIDMWNVKFHKEPITLESLIPKTQQGKIKLTKDKSEYKDNILYFKDKEIDFSNKQNQKDLLRTLFKNPNKNWFYDEIQEDWDETGTDKDLDSKNFWRKFYSAGDDINKAVAIKTGVEGFIIKNTKEIRINPKYI